MVVIHCPVRALSQALAAVEASDATGVPPKPNAPHRPAQALYEGAA